MYTVVICLITIVIYTISVPIRCYDKDEYRTSTQDEFIVPVAFGAGLSSTSLGSGPSFRTSSLLGGERPLEVDGQTMEIVEMIVKEYNRREDDSEYYKLVKVHEASKQVREFLADG